MTAEPGPRPTPTGSNPGGMAALEALARDFYRFRLEDDPVTATDQGFHDLDHRLGDYSPAALGLRRAATAAFRARFDALDPAAFAGSDRIDWVLFRAQLDRDDFYDRVRDSAHRDPGLYVGECSNAIFSLLKKPFAPNPVKVKSATARLKAMPGLLEQARQNLARPVALYARLALDSVAGVDPLFQVSLMEIVVGVSPAEKQALVAARDGALASLHGFAAWLKEKLPEADPSFAIGREPYRRLLHRVLLLPFEPEEIATLGEVELGRAKALEAWAPFPPFPGEISPGALPSRPGVDPVALADQKVEPLPRSEAEFLAGYERRQADLLRFLRERRILTVPADIGEFRIRELPRAFKPTSPGGFMNPPGVYDQDVSGFYFIPTFEAGSRNFFLRAAIDDPRPILGHEGIPGHHLQISLSNRHPRLIRRYQDDNVFIEGWAFYTEEMLLRTGLYEDRPRSVQQVNRLARLRAARIACDVRLQTGVWSFEQAVDYLMQEGGMDREAAEGEAAGAAAWPGQKIGYALGKWQIQRLLGLYRDSRGKDFTLQAFHDQLLAHGSVPLSIVEWEMLGREETWKVVEGKR